MKKVAVKEREPVINKVAKRKKGFVFTTVERDKTVVNMLEKKQQAENGEFL
jgi:hypothetical protein